MGRTFDMVILATRMSSCLQGKGMSIGPATVNEPTRLRRLSLSCYGRIESVRLLIFFVLSGNLMCIMRRNLATVSAR